MKYYKLIKKEVGKGTFTYEKGQVLKGNYKRESTSKSITQLAKEYPENWKEVRDPDKIILKNSSLKTIRKEII